METKGPDPVADPDKAGSVQSNLFLMKTDGKLMKMAVRSQNQNQSKEGKFKKQNLKKKNQNNRKNTKIWWHTS